MIPDVKKGISDEAREVLNGYPAFAEAQSNFIVPDFFDNVFRKWLATDKETTPRICKRYIDSLWCDPGRDVDARCCTDNLAPFSEDEAWELLCFMEPLWCQYKGIDSTGYLRDTRDLLTASELLDDDTLDI